MSTIGIDQLEPNHFYWAQRIPEQGVAASDRSDIEIVQISTVFGAMPEFWTVAVMGSDEHFDLATFEFLYNVPPPIVASSSRFQSEKHYRSIAITR